MACSAQEAGFVPYLLDVLRAQSSLFHLNIFAVFELHSRRESWL